MAAKKAAAPVAPIIVKKVIVQGGGHHGGAWKVAYADFVTAMMAFFLLMWLLGATTEKQRKGLADYFTPTLVKTRQQSGGGSGLLGGSSLTEVDKYPNRQGQTGTKTLTIPRDTTGGPKEGDRTKRMGGHLQFLALVMRSYEAFPPGAAWFSAARMELVAGFATAMFATGVAIALPVTLVLLVVQVVTGVLSRSAPTLNLFALGLPAGIIAGLAALIASAPLLADRLTLLSADAVAMAESIVSQ